MGLLQLTFCVSKHAGGCVEHLPICCREEIFEAGSQALQAAVKSHQLVQDQSRPQYAHLASPSPA